MKTIIIKQNPTDLYKILKFESLSSSGGGAKYLIAQGQIEVNGVVETRKRKKIMAGDIIKFAGEQYQVVVEGDAGESASPILQ